MTLAHQSDFALRTLKFLTGSRNHRVISGEITQRFDIPINRLVKIINELFRRKHVQTLSSPSRGGGLARESSGIPQGEVIEDFKTCLRLHDCGLSTIETIRQLRGVLLRADEARTRFLYRFTLADTLPRSFDQKQKAFDPLT